MEDCCVWKSSEQASQAGCGPSGRRFSRGSTTCLRSSLALPLRANKGR